MTMHSLESKKWIFRSSLLFYSAMLLLYGCAATEKQLSRNDLKPINEMKIAYSDPPPLLKETTGTMAAAFTGVMFGAIGGALSGAMSYKMMESNGKELQEKCNLPNYGDLLFKKLVERIPKEVRGWPQMVVEKRPLSEDVNNLKDYIFFVRVNLLMVKNGVGLSTAMTAQLNDPQGNVLWKKNVRYQSKESSRLSNLDVLEANNGKLLHEEYEFAIENTVSTLIKDLNGDSPQM